MTNIYNMVRNINLELVLNSTISQNAHFYNQ